MITPVEVWGISKAAGSLTQAALGFWDRARKYTPEATLVARPLISGSAQIVPRLVVKNNAPRPIIISWQNGAQGHLPLALDDTLENIFIYTYDSRTTLDVEEERVFPVLRPAGFREMPPHASLVIDLKWKFAQPYRWKPERKLPVWITKEDLQTLVGHSWEV
jgi:hypothetical protein